MLDQDEINALLEQTDDIDDSAKKAEDQANNNDQVTAEDIDALVADAGVDDNDFLEEHQGETCPLGSETWVEQKIKDAHLPYPVEPEHKVVDQLSRVTQDGEAKAGEVFDSISDAVDKLNNIDQQLTQLNTQTMNMMKFVMALQTKFPNIEVIGKKSQDVQLMLTSIETIKNNSNEATNDLFKAMETMQYQDISRQKIERVINVVKKLSEYLNNVFETDSTKPDVKIAKHIHGDTTDGNVLADEDDIDDLIKEFGIDK